MTETPFTAPATPGPETTENSSAQALSASAKDVIVVLGPSGAGKRAAIGILEDLFDYSALTKVTLERLVPLTEAMPMNRLVFHLFLSGRGAEVLADGYSRLLDQCVECFGELQRRCRRFQILFLYCVQEELANRQTVGFHPLQGLCGTLKAAIFKESEMLVQLFCRLADDPTLRRHVSFVDTSGLPVSGLRGPLEEQLIPRDLPPVHSPPQSFATRGWNQMRRTLKDVEQQYAKFLEERQRRGKNRPELGRLNCLLLGETGVGKELIAAHLAGGDHQMVRLNCEGMPRDLLESELWGHVKGAFTHAVRDRDGLVIQAKGKTLFVDEIGFADPVVQQKLLRFIDTREYKKLGSDKWEPRVDCQIIAATSRDLEQDTHNGTFLPDLYYRLAGVTITVPPLRQRREDIPILLDYFLDDDGGWKRFSPEALGILFDYRWDGNVRTLRNAVAQCRQPEGDILAEHLPAHVTRAYEGWRQYHDRMNIRFWRAQAEPSVDIDTYTARLKGAVLTGEYKQQRHLAMKEILLEALEKNGWNVTKTAKELKRNRTSIYRDMKRLGVHRPRKARVRS